MNLRKQRLKAGLTQKELAQRLNLPRQTYQHYEYGTRTPSEEKMHAIEEALRIINHSYIKKEESNLIFSIILMYIILSFFIIFIFCGD